MADAPNVPRCVLKVNIQCCPGCPRKLKKKLLKINGVEAIDIDIKNGLVSVRGSVQPSILIQTISEKIGKKAELHAYEKNPEIQNEKLRKGHDSSDSKYDEKIQTCPFTDKSKDSIKGKDDQAVHNEVKGGPVPEVPKKKKTGFAGWFGKKSTVVEPRMFGGFGGRPRPGYNARMPPPPLPPPPLPPAFHRPSYGYGQYPQPPQVCPYSPPYRITKPPRPYPYDFYEATGPPMGNSVFHAFRDDNVNSCTIS